MNNQKQKLDYDEMEEKKEAYADLRNLLQEDDLLTYRAYIEDQTIVLTIYTFDIPLKQIKLDLTSTEYKIIKEGKSNGKS